MGRKSNAGALVLIVLAALLPTAALAAGHEAHHRHRSGGSLAVYGRYCQAESRRHVKGERRTPFSDCVSAMQSLASHHARSPSAACRELSRRRTRVQKGSPFSLCLTAASELLGAGSAPISGGSTGTGVGTAPNTPTPKPTFIPEQPPSSGGPSAPPAPGELPPGARLSPGQSVSSPAGQYQLIMQSDGNLVLYTQGEALWNSGTVNNPGAWAIMQGDGNLVVYSAANRALWQSGTPNNPGASLNVQDDGNLVVYSPSNRALWSTGTINYRLMPGQKLTAGQALYATGEQYRLVMQSDGNLVLYAQSTPIWQSHTYPHPGAWAVMQSDGNLVVYSASNTPLWQSGTAGHSGAWLAVQGDGNLVVYSSANAPLWASGTAGQGPAAPPATSNGAGSDAQALQVASTAESYNDQVAIPRWFAAAHYLGTYWSGYCEAFVALVAYGGSGYSTAYADYLSRRGAGLIHQGVPPRGAIVYWNPENNNVGHVGISLGGGEEISTYGFVGNAYPIQEHPYLYFGNYLGWAMPY